MLGNLFRREAIEQRSGLSWSDYQRLFEQFAYQGHRYIAPSVATFAELTALQGARNPIVAAAINARLLVFSEVRFLWQPFGGGRPGRMFGNEELSILERPWQNATTGDLLARMLVDADLYGNSYWVRRTERGSDELVRLDPNRVVIVTGDYVEQGHAYGKELVAYAVVDDDQENELVTFLPDEVCHFKPLPDPTHPFRGRTWLTSVLPDVTADDEFTNYKHTFMRNAATPNLVVSFDPSITKEAFETFVSRLDATHKGADKAFKTLYLGGGADVKVVGANFDQLNLKAVQGAGETRIASAAGVPASYLGISESLGGSSLNAGNYTAARRRFADGTIRPLWRAAADSLGHLLARPDPTVRLWYDDRDVAFLQEDVLDTAEIRAKDAQTMRTLVDGGFEAESVVDAVTTGDMTLLRHTGTLSVQLQPIGSASDE
jgi:HK97 family phage portal protein